MNDLLLYEKMPQEAFLLRFLKYTDSPYRVFSHWHEHIEMHLILDGECTLKNGEEEILLRAGDCAVINGNDLHMGCGGRCSFICLILSPDFFENHRTVFQKRIRDAYVSELIERITRGEKPLDNVTDLESRGYAYLLISHLIKNYGVRTLSETVYSQHFKKVNLVNRAVRFMNAHYAEPLSTCVLADEVHLSEGYFCEIFKAVTGKTVLNYLNGLRVEKAEQLLRTTDMTVSEVAFCCGFSDANYFSRTYKRLMGKTPRQSREG